MKILRDHHPTTAALNAQRKSDDRGVNIPEGLVVGEDPEFDAKWFRRSDKGVTLITQSMVNKYLAEK